MKIIDFLSKTNNNIQKNFFNKQINIGPLIFIVLSIIIVFMIVLSVKRYKNNKKSTFLNFLIFFMIIPTLFLLTPESITIKPEKTYNNEAYQNYDYILNVIEEPKKLIIIVETKSEIKELNFTLFFYNAKDQLIYADSNKLVDLENDYYKTFEYDIPSAILLSGGKYNIKQYAYKSIIQATEVEVNGKAIRICLSLGILFGIVGATVINKKIRKNKHNKENIFPYQEQKNKYNEIIKKINNNEEKSINE